MEDAEFEQFGATYENDLCNDKKNNLNTKDSATKPTHNLVFVEKNFVLALFSIFGAFFILTIFVGNVLFSPHMVVGISMQPTYNTNVATADKNAQNDTVYISKCNYYNRFDVVVFYSETEEKNLIKRVVGVPGDKIAFKQKKSTIENGMWYVYYNLVLNGEELQEEYIAEPMKLCMSNMDTNTNALLSFIVTEETIVLGENEYYCLGDNRNNSYDSRYLGSIAYEDICGKVFFKTEYGEGLFVGILKEIF